jgi:sugar phosphate isomerase/epimerase
MKLAAKCRPDRHLFSAVNKAGIEGLEIYLFEQIIRKPAEIIKLCGDFPFDYAVHAPNDCFSPQAVRAIAAGIGAKNCVFHNMFWEDEWKEIIREFENSGVKICVENILGVHEPLKFERRYKTGRCLDLEHLQMECLGIYEEEFIPWISQASHIHLTGYSAGSSLWHTHIHYDKSHGAYMLDLIARSGYAGLVVSEARVSTQTEDEFAALAEFFKNYKNYLPAKQ